MDILKKKLEECLNEHLLKITISNPRRAEEIRKYSIRPVLLREQICFQVESHTKTQVFHENLDKEETLARLADILPLYKQVQIRTEPSVLTRAGRSRIPGRRICPGCCIIVPNIIFWRRDVRSRFLKIWAS